MDKLEEKMVLREAGRRLFHREGPITVKDLDLNIVVLAQCIHKFPTVSSCAWHQGWLFSPRTMHLHGFYVVRCHSS